MNRRNCDNDRLNDVVKINVDSHEEAKKKTNGTEHSSPSELTPNSQLCAPVSALGKQFASASSGRAKPLKMVKEGDQSTFEDNGGSFVETFGTENGVLCAKALTDVCFGSPKRVLEVDPENQALAALHAIAPRDGLEGMLAAQMVAVNNHAMSLLNKACEAGVSEEIIEARENRANKFMRTFTMQMEALGKYRQKENQNTVVGQVHVHEGGQAVVAAMGSPSITKSSEASDEQLS